VTDCSCYEHALKKYLASMARIGRKDYQEILQANCEQGPEQFSFEYFKAEELENNDEHSR